MQDILPMGGEGVNDPGDHLPAPSTAPWTAPARPASTVRQATPQPDDPARLVLLGTAGGPTPKVSRSAPAQAVVAGGRIYLFDAGNGVARQLVRAGLSVQDLRAVGITHHHSDHVADLGTVLQLAWGGGLRSAVDAFGPPPLTAMLGSFADYAVVDIDTRVADEGRPPFGDLIHACDIRDDGEVFADANVRIRAARVSHPPMTAYAYRIDTADRSFVISGDTAPCDALVELARGADVLVHEAMHLPSIGPLLAEVDDPRLLREHLVRSHTSTDDVGGIARAAGVGTLVLSHLVPTDANLDTADWTRQAATEFDGPVILGDDLMWL